MFLRIVCAAFGLLFGCGFGFAIGGLASGVVVGIVFGVVTQTNPVEVINAAFAQHPWGLAAALIVGGEVAGTLTGAWFAVKLSDRVFWALPPMVRARSNVAFVLFLVVLPLVGALELPTPIRLSLQSVRTTGKVLGLYPQEHGTISYAYTVGGRSFQQRGSPQQLDGLSVGTSVPVYYLPAAPSVSILHEPRGEFWRVLLNVLLGSAFVCTWLTVAFTSLQQRLRRPNHAG